jgi:hypothetical protein
LLKLWLSILSPHRKFTHMINITFTLKPRVSLFES